MLKTNLILKKINSQSFFIKLNENCRNLPDVLEVAKLFAKLIHIRDSKI